eukprot:786814-Pyramimonas_sp.AAC.1
MVACDVGHGAPRSTALSTLATRAAPWNPPWRHRRRCQSASPRPVLGRNRPRASMMSLGVTRGLRTLSIRRHWGAGTTVRWRHSCPPRPSPSPPALRPLQPAGAWAPAGCSARSA